MSNIVVHLHIFERVTYAAYHSNIDHQSPASRMMKGRCLKHHPDRTPAQWGSM